jgi:hypothetical protein
MKFRCNVGGMRTGLAMWIALVLLVSCANNPDAATREECRKVADHIADLIIDHYKAHPDELWDGLSQGDSTRLPQGVTKETFKAYLDTPQGRTWLMQAHGNARSGTEQGVDACMQQATPKQVKCLLAAKTKDDVLACDKAKTPRDDKAK